MKYALESRQVLLQSLRWKVHRVHVDEKGIEANLDKFHTIIAVRRYTNVKEVHLLTGFLAAMSRFLSCVGDKAFLLFAALKKKDKF